MRIALTVPEQAVLQRSPLPSLPAVFLAADPGWGPTIHALVALGARHGVSPAAFGSLLWQYLTGLPYLSPRSDLDVLWPVQADCEIGALAAGIAAAELGAPMRIDGEVVFPDGEAVNWRELHSALNQDGPTEVLAKSTGGVRLLDVSRAPTTWRAA
jgi:phosphoribosyl-dephospho-CoA transferase